MAGFTDEMVLAVAPPRPDLVPHLPSRPGPEHMPDKTWSEYYAWLRDRDGDTAPPVGDSDAESDAPEEPEAAIVITVPAHEIEEGWPTALGTWRKRLIAGGWDLKVGHASAEVADVWLVDGSAIRYPGWTCDTYWINAVLGDDYLTIGYTLKNGASLSNRTLRHSAKYWWRKWSDKEMQDYVMGTDHTNGSTA